MLGLSLVFLLSVLLAAFFRKIKFPLIAGFLIAGLIIGVKFLNEDVAHFIEEESEFGAVFLLFLVGIELRLDHFKKIGSMVIWLTLLQLFLFILTIASLLWLFNFSLVASLILATVVSFSSTVLVASVLKDKKQMNSYHGRMLIGVLLLQDFIVVGLFMLLPIMTNMQGSVISIVTKMVVGIILSVVVIWFGQYLFSRLRHLFRRDYDVVFLLSMGWTILLMGLYSLPQIDFPTEIAGLIAGISLASVYQRDRVVEWFEPLTKYYLVFLFLFIGTQVNVKYFYQDFWFIIGLLALIMLLKFGLAWLTTMIVKLPQRVSLVVAAGLANISELGFILLPLIVSMQLITERELAIFGLVILLSMIVSALVLYNINTISWRLFSYFRGIDDKLWMDSFENNIEYKGYTVLVGCHRTGRSILKMWKHKEKLLVIDYDQTVVNDLIEQGYEALMGDVADESFLYEIGLFNAKTIVSTIPSIDDNLKMAEILIQTSKVVTKPFMVAMASNGDEVRELYQAGVKLVLDKYFTVAHSYVNFLNARSRMTYVRKIKDEQRKILGMI